MNSRALKNVVRIALAIALQALVFKQILLGGEDFNYFHLMIYPVAIMLLPIDVPSVVVIFAAFVTGLTVDIFYDSPGLHGGALVIMAFLRPAVLRFFAPDSGYSKNAYPVAFSFGLLWYAQYSAAMLFIFLFAYFSLEAFTFVYIKSIMLKTFFSFMASYAIILLHQIIMNPRS